MKKTLLSILAAALLFGAVGLFCYPLHQTQKAQQAEQAEIHAFSTYLEEQKAPQTPQESTNASEPLVPFERLLEACRAYNERIYAEEQRNLDGQTMKQAPLDLAA